MAIKLTNYLCHETGFGRCSVVHILEGLYVPGSERSKFFSCEATIIITLTPDSAV